MLGLALQRVVIHLQDLLVVVLAGDGVGDLVQIDQLVDEDEHAAVSGSGEKAREQLDVVVPGVVIDDGAYPQFRSGLRLGAVLAAQPFDGAAFCLVIALGTGRPVHAEYARELEAVDHFLEVGELPAKAGACRAVICRDAYRGSGIHRGRVRCRRILLCLDIGDPFIENQSKGPAFGPRFGREIADELTIGCEALTLTTL